ncbi:hypothetical protein JCM10213_003809 [Rhodosporidiobolus nylandii]
MPSLLDLPAELLDCIVDLAGLGNRTQYLGLVHRAFLHRSRRLLFRDVQVSSFERLALLCAVVQGSEVVGRTIRELCIGMRNEPEESKPANGAVLALFTRLSCLTALTVAGSSRLAKLALTPPKRATPTLPCLESLCVTSALTGWSNPLHPSYLAGLERYPELYWLEVDIERPPPTLGRTLPTSAPRLTLGGLVLKGDFLENPATPILLSSLPHLWCLTLSTYSSPSPATFGSLLDAVPNPRKMQGLHLQRSANEGQNISSSLARFVSLEALILCTSTFTPECLPVLQSFTNLEILRFHTFAGLSMPLCRQLLTTYRPPSLEAVKLWNILEILGDDAGPAEDGAAGWSWRRNGTVALLRLAKEVGVELHGLPDLRTIALEEGL